MLWWLLLGLLGLLLVEVEGCARVGRGSSADRIALRGRSEVRRGRCMLLRARRLGGFTPGRVARLLTVLLRRSRRAPVARVLRHLVRRVLTGCRPGYGSTLVVGAVWCLRWLLIRRMHCRVAIVLLLVLGLLLARVKVLCCSSSIRRAWL